MPPRYSGPAHGTYYVYRHRGCRCDACTAAARQQWCKLKAGQRNGHVLQSVDEVRRHLYWLQSRGMTLKSIAAVGGIAPSTVIRIWQQHQEVCTAAVADAILSVSAYDLVRSDKVEGWRVHKLVAGLRAAGVTNRQLGKALRYKYPRGVNRITNGREERYTRRTFERLALLYQCYAQQGLVPATVLVEVEAPTWE